MGKRFTAVLFDLDGTILNTLGDLHGAVNAVLAGAGLPQRSLDEIRQFCGTGNRNLLRAVLPEGTTEEQLDQYLQEFRDFYLLHDREETVPYPGIPELFSELAERGIRVGVVSNKFHRAVVGLCRHYFGSLVGAAIGDGEGRRRKPAPDACLAALSGLGIPAEAIRAGEVLYVGDSEVDARTAENAGLPCVLVSWGFRERAVLEQQNAMAIVDDAEGLRAWIFGDGCKGEGMSGAEHI